MPADKPRVKHPKQERAGEKREKVELEESFRFLLERESNTSILSSFDLPVIDRYFPEYEQEIRTRLRRTI